MEQANEEIDKSENENDLNSSNQPLEETKEKPKAKKSNDDNADGKKSQDSTKEPRELVSCGFKKLFKIFIIKFYRNVGDCTRK